MSLLAAFYIPMRYDVIYNGFYFTLLANCGINAVFVGDMGLVYYFYSTILHFEFKNEIYIGNFIKLAKKKFLNEEKF